ncbi:hypothetical protein CVD28_07775 [Bacillus sp. M6-12]|uniref:restriction endonuclease subunit S n=1 Tax=Bacillus sp. M6-12 TaxID=2054166 RepID=UPI000C774B8D|nr:restriction endonuclease subunit S [Bacillus sp. M6-12]PLS18180.1 hypothetical protein CVD28_07775 [Bacillus sp. M6-12]
MQNYKAISIKPSISFINTLLFEERLDAKYYSNFNLALMNKLIDSNLEIKPLGELSSKITQGPNPNFLKDKTGVPCLRTRNVYDEYITLEGANFVSKTEYEKLKRFKIQYGDILVAILGEGSIGKSNIFTLNDEAIFNRPIGLVRIKGSKTDPFYVSTYLRSYYGKKILERGISGSSGQLVLGIEYLKVVPVPLPEMKIQTYIGDKIRMAEKLRSEAKLLNQQCIEIFNETIKFNMDFIDSDFSISFDDYKTLSSKPSIIYTTKNFGMKISPQYYHPRRVYLLEQLRKLPLELLKLTDLAKRISGKSKVNSLRYVGPDCIDNTFGHLSPVEVDVSSNTVKAQIEDILFCRLRPNLNNVTICDNEEVQASAEFLQYRANDKFKYVYYLFFVLRQPTTLYQIVDTAIGDRPRVDEDLVDELLIPIIEEGKMSDINAKIKNMYANLRLSESLISEAKQDIVDIIEGKFDNSKISKIAEGE